jgi:hypothetical protein
MITNIALLATIVATLTQVVKGWKLLAGFNPRYLSIAIAVIVVAVVLLIQKQPLDLQVIISTVTAILAANGGYKLLNPATP